MTENAKIILDIINSSDEHFTAEQIYFMLKKRESKMVLATVYNNLSTLLNQGFVRKVSVESYPDRYDRAKPHDHLICKRCGKLSDIFLEDLTKKLQNQIDPEIISYDLKISYICPDCREAEKRK